MEIKTMFCNLCKRKIDLYGLTAEGLHLSGYIMSPMKDELKWVAINEKHICPKCLTVIWDALAPVIEKRKIDYDPEDAISVMCLKREDLLEYFEGIDKSLKDSYKQRELKEKKDEPE